MTDPLILETSQPVSVSLNVSERVLLNVLERALNRDLSWEWTSLQV